MVKKFNARLSERFRQRSSTISSNGGPEAELFIGGQKGNVRQGVQYKYEEVLDGSVSLETTIPA